MPSCWAGDPVTLSISIVTPTLNRLAMLKEAVESVRAQGYPRVEHLIVDGGSSDGTGDWVAAQVDLTLLPGPDRGVYDAMNKGIAAARGDVIGLLNSDDFYEPGAFAAVAAVFRAHPEAEVVAGRARLVEGNATVERYEAPADLVPDVRSILVGHCLPNARFFRADILNRVGPFRLEHGLVADRDFLVRLVEARVRVLPIEAPLYVYRRHEGSLTFDGNLKLSLRLRHELLKLGRRWRDNGRASERARSAGRILEGRQRLMLGLTALRLGHPGEAFSHLLGEKGKPSARAASAVALALIDATTAGRR